jgi:hypothetical protein
MFKFFKEMIDAVREGAAEAKAELAQEAAEQEAAGRAAAADSQARVAAISAYEKFLVALAAPYKQTYTRELTDAARDERPAEFLFCMALPPGEKVEEFQSMLNRDFGVTELASLQTAYAALLMVEIDPDVPVEDKASLALAVARAAYLVCTGVAVGYVAPLHGLSMTVPVVERALARFDGWEDYGQHFVAGEKAAAGSNALGSGFLKRSVEALSKEAASPWRHLPWPVLQTEQDALYASRPRGQAAAEASTDQ